MQKSKFTMITVSENNEVKTASLNARRTLNNEGKTKSSGASQVAKNGTDDRLLRLRTRHMR